jgi:hypothetical protein
VQGKMRINVEINSSENFDYEYFIDWLNDQLSDSSMCGMDSYASIVKIMETEDDNQSQR